jgi:hypothetical protein
MKTTTTLALMCTVALGALALSSCVTGSEGPDRSSGVSFTAGIKKASNSLTRTTNGGDTWIAGDGVGIYMLSAGGSIPSGVLFNMANKRYKVVSVTTGELSPDPNTDPVIEYPLSGAAVDFVAYYPCFEEAENKIDANGIYPVVLTDQSDPAKIDVMIAKKSGATSGSVKLQFRHALSKITLNIRLAAGVTTISKDQVAAIADVKVMSTPGSAGVDVNTGEITDGPNAAIAMLKSTSAATDYDATFSAIVTPISTGNSDGRYISILFNGKSVVWAIPSSVAFEHGQHYTFWGEITETDFRVSDTNITEWSDNSKGLLKEEIPAKIQQNYRITWDGVKKQYAITNDPTNCGLYFKFGSVVGIYTAHGAVQTLPVDNENVNRDTFEAANDVAWDPTGNVKGDADAGWATVPSYIEADYPNAITSDYHTVANVKAGKGDPCRLVGLDLYIIRTRSVDFLTTADIDNGKWRLPTVEENKLFSGRDFNGAYIDHWNTQKGVNGGIFPNSTIGDETTFLPAIGYRNGSNGKVFNQSFSGDYWSSVPNSATDGTNLCIYDIGINPLNVSIFSHGAAVRCVLQ